MPDLRASCRDAQRLPFRAYTGQGADLVAALICRRRILGYRSSGSPA